METIDRIEKLLKESGIPNRKVKRALSEACAISYQAVRDWFSGSTQKISPDYIAIIAEKWGSSSDYLITGETINSDRLLKMIDQLSPDMQLDLYEKLGRKIQEKHKHK